MHMFPNEKKVGSSNDVTVVILKIHESQNMRKNLLTSNINFAVFHLNQQFKSYW